MSTVIVGSGQAGLQVAATLRQNGYDGRIVLIGDEPSLPYQRPPLSKKYLLGAVDEAELLLRPATYYAENAIELRTGESVVSIDRRGATATTSSCESIDWENLVIATGARPRTLGIPGEDLTGVFTLRLLTDAAVIAERLPSVTDVVIVGGGFVGLELASGFLDLGFRTTLLSGSHRLMDRAVSPEVSTHFATHYVDRRLDLHLGARVTEFLGEDGRVMGIRTADGRIFDGQFVVVGAGVVPNVELAAEAGLDVDNGIVVDSSLRTSDDRIFAIGDCARFPSIHAGMPWRLESVQNATDQANHVAAEILSGTRREYADLPWFWSDQKNLKLQIAGLAANPHRTAVLGDPHTNKFSVAVFRDDRLVAVESVNKPADYQAARRVLGRKMILSYDRVTAPGFELTSAKE
ncbi:MAG TPA: FAD-dependent oxidoreductase [Pseudolysinimonas sp.]|nr:FAD-dependent oxidoreductase [Pseudolysinimonas sp.]